MRDSLSTIDGLIKSLHSDDPTVVNTAAKGLVEKGAEIIPSLCALLTDAEKPLRDTIIWILVEIGSPSVTHAIQLLKEGTPVQQSAAVEVLGTLASHESIDPLIEALRADEQDLRDAASWALVQIGEEAVPRVIDFLKNESAYFRDTALWVLSGIGEPAVSSMIAAISPGESRRNRFIIENIAGLGGSFLSHLHDLLRHDDADIRRLAALTLGRLSHDESIEHLLPLLKDQDREVRHAVIQSLSLMGVKICPRLFELINTDDVMLLDSVFMVYCALGQDVSALLMEKITVTNADLRKRIVKALGIIRDPSSIDVLINCLHDPDTAVRDTAAWALGELGDTSAIGPLMASLQDESLGINFSLAPWALAKLHAVEEIERLKELLNSPVPGIRWKSALGLGLLRDFRATAPLLERINDQSPEVRRRVISSLGDLLDPAAVEPLRELLLSDDGSCQTIIKDALKRIKCGEPSVKDPFA